MSFQMSFSYRSFVKEMDKRIETTEISFISG